MSIIAINPTSRPRREVIVFGCEPGTSEGALLRELPDSEIRAAYVEIPACYDGPVEPIPPPPAVDPSRARVFPDIRANGVGFAPPITLEKNSLLEVAWSIARSRNIVFHLFLYLSPYNPFIRFELLALTESLHENRPQISVEIDAGPGYRAICRTVPDSQKRWFDGPIYDMQGIAFAGVLLPEEIPTDDPWQYSTWMAARDFDVFATGDWTRRWGPWDRTMMVGGTHPDRGNDQSPLAHRGLILNKRPGDTGEQAGFGYWKGLDALGPKQLHNLIHDYYAGLQSCCRPIFVLREDGRIPEYDDFPRYRSWSETWDSRITKETFRRTYKPAARYEGWLGEDEEHYNDATSLLYLIKTTGSFAIQHIVKMKAFHWVRQNRFPAIGRALGRGVFNGINLYNATGHARIREEARARFLPAMLGTWRATNGEFDPSLEGLKKPYALRLILNDPQTHIKGFGWYAWEDAMAAAALDRISFWLDSAEIRLMALFLSRSVVQYGIEERPGGKFQIAKAIEWQGPGKLGEQIAWADQTNYLEWGAACVGVSVELSLAHGDAETAEKAAKIAEQIKSSGYWNLDSYLANLL